MTAPISRARNPRPPLHRLVVVAIAFAALGAAAGVVSVVGSIDIALADYGMERPTSFLVLSISDTATIEFQLKFTKTA